MQLTSMRSQKGIALISALLLIVIVGGILTLMFSRATQEIQHSRDDLGITQTLILARGGAVAASNLLQGSLLDEAKTIVTTYASTSARFSFGCSSSTGTNVCGNTDTTPNAARTASDLDSIATNLQTQADSKLCNNINFSPVSTATVRVRLYFTNQACGSTGLLLPTGIKLPEGRWIEGTPRTGTGAEVKQVYSLPFVLVSEAEQGSGNNKYKRNMVLQGEYRLVLGRSNFARFAYFSNIRTTDGTQANGNNVVWFSDNELIDGPVHSNEYLRFASYTSNQTRTWFGEEVTVAGCTNPSLTVADPNNPSQFLCGNNNNKSPGDYFNSNSSTLRTPSTIDSYCTTVTCPEFAKAATFNASYIPLPLNNTIQRNAALGISITKNEVTNTDVVTRLTNEGLFLGDPNNTSNSLPIKDLKLFTTTVSGVTYQNIQVDRCTGSVNVSAETCTSQVTEYRYTTDGSDVNVNKLCVVTPTISKILPCIVATNSSSTLVNGNLPNPINNFNGMIYVDSAVWSLGGPTRTTASNPDTAAPAMTDFAKMTIATKGKIDITRDLKYTTPPCTGNPKRVNGVVERAICTTTGLNATNILGIYSQGDNTLGRDVLFGDGTSSKLTNLTVQAVVMSASGRVGTNNWQGSLGTASDLRLLGGVIGKNVAGFSNGTGYKRVFTYDRRMMDGVSPPFFPTIEVDQLQSIFVFTYGQKEQVY
jgi:Domain of unknown function (DUF4900)